MDSSLNLAPENLGHGPFLSLNNQVILTKSFISFVLQSASLQNAAVRESQKRKLHSTQNSALHYCAHGSHD